MPVLLLGIMRADPGRPKDAGWPDAHVLWRTGEPIPAVEVRPDGPCDQAESRAIEAGALAPGQSHIEAEEQESERGKG